MKLSSRKELLNEAEEVLRQIRNENKQNLNEGVLYNIWSKIVDKIEDHADPQRADHRRPRPDKDTDGQKIA
jgi:hypothetical protein